MDHWPTVTAVIPTRNRTGLLKETIDSILGQDYPGEVTCVAVFDQSPVEESVARDTPGRRVLVTENTRNPGIAGARNTGVLLDDGELVAFCDDTDLWLPHKLRSQVTALGSGHFVTCGVELFNDKVTYARSVAAPSVTMKDLLHKQLPSMHPSTYLMRREALVNGFGLVSEELPGGYCEDYELLLRGARFGPITNLPETGVRLRMHNGSYFSIVESCGTISSALRWMLEHYPEFEKAPSGYAQVAGKIAFAEATLGHTSQALHWVGQIMRRRPWEPRAYLALAVAAGVPADAIVSRLQRIGRGI
ncbi:glycosyltransferase involved in cell wall biosynthesis [Streptosporangium album]|uniref:Glycosyltransferase involved in cell wall biosynthesis n=1 Tax=Streptosporangium album TaxID=47479 RepID=A0A7W7W6X0_9ACTN|nr:glycosyltransferase family A protein [Streptosporangium album]MBB4936702.1 glycosyltransferase involved in cell wall biosynthesis [Streptosporangium album]